MGETFAGFGLWSVDDSDYVDSITRLDTALHASYIQSYKTELFLRQEEGLFRTTQSLYKTGLTPMYKESLPFGMNRPKE